jgi:N-acetylmuramoyl-L-alanine amidase
VHIIRRHDRGDAVRDVQHRLTELGHRIDAMELEGVFGPSTEAAVRAFQQQRSLPPDGIVGPDTWGQLVEAGYRLGDRTLYLRSPAFRGDDVRALQRMLNALGFDAGKEDGILGRDTARAIREFQRNVADRVDGIVGLDTVRTLERMRPVLDGPGRALVREGETIRTMVASLAGSTIAIDAGHLERDLEPPDPLGSREEHLTLALAAELARALEERGATPAMLRAPGEDPTPSDRAQSANALGADVCVSLRLGAQEPKVPGAACAYWGTATTHSPAGRRLAELIQTELRGVGLPDAGLRPLAITLLRETTMPAVQVEPGHIDDADHEFLLTDPTFRRRVAVAIADGIDRFLRGSSSA